MLHTSKLYFNGHQILDENQNLIASLAPTLPKEETQLYGKAFSHSLEMIQLLKSIQENMFNNYMEQNEASAAYNSRPTVPSVEPMSPYTKIPAELQAITDLLNQASTEEPT